MLTLLGHLHKKLHISDDVHHYIIDAIGPRSVSKNFIREKFHMMQSDFTPQTTIDDTDGPLRIDVLL